MNRRYRLERAAYRSHEFLARRGRTAHVRLRSAAHAEVIAELDRPLTVLARYACDGAQPSRVAGTSQVPTRQELTIIGIRLTLLHAPESMHRVAQTVDNRVSTGHPAAVDLRAASDALVAGRDLVHTYDSAT